MFRARLTGAVVAAGLGLICGCSNLTNHSWFSRTRAAPVCDACEAAPLAVGGGPILDSGGPVMVAPEGPAGPLPTPLPPDATVPPFATPPRLVPQPQAQPVPAVPSRRTPGIIT